MDKFEEFRTHVPLLQKQAYLDTASTGLIPDYIFDGVLRYQNERYLIGGDSTWEIGDDHPHGTLDMLDWSKAKLADMIGCKKEEIFFGNNASQLYSMGTSSFPFRSGDNVILPQNGYITSRFAWQILEKNGLEIRYAKPVEGALLPEDYYALCDEHTIALGANLVESATGYRIDIEALGEFCREREIYLFVDGVQALGVLPVDVKRANIDYLVGDDYKWMMGFCGAAYAYISKRMLEKINQRTAGWFSDDERFNTGKQVLRLRADAGRFETGYPTAHGIYALGLAADKYCKMGKNDIKNYVLTLCDTLNKKLEEIPGVELRYHFRNENRSPIEIIAVDDRLSLDDNDFKKANVAVHFRASDLVGKRHIRLAVHYYNNLEDIERFCAVLEAATL